MLTATQYDESSQQQRDGSKRILLQRCVIGKCQRKHTVASLIRTVEANSSKSEYA